MKTTKQELFDKCEKMKAHQAGLLNLIHGIEEKPDIHFEIGQKNPNGTTRCVYSSTSIQRLMSEYASAGYTEKNGWFIDVWEGGEPAADISIPTKKDTPWQAVEPCLDEGKTIFEINKKVATGTVGDLGNPTIYYELETVFRSTVPEDCQKEWAAKQYTKDDYVMDIRVARNGKESYHFADIDTESMCDIMCKDRRSDILNLIAEYQDNPLKLAEAIVKMYKGDKP